MKLLEQYHEYPEASGFFLGTLTKFNPLFKNDAHGISLDLNLAVVNHLKNKASPQCMRLLDFINGYNKANDIQPF